MSKVEVKQIPHTIFNIFEVFSERWKAFHRHISPCAVLPSKSKAKDVYVVDTHLSESTARKQR